MKKMIIALGLISLLTFSPDKSLFPKSPQEKVHWGYEGNIGPENWANLSPEYFWCGLKNQSPVDINKKYTVLASLPKLNLNYGILTNPEVINNGHTIQVNVSENFTLEIMGKKYNLIQFHFHEPSEHTLEGKFFPMELHLVHKDKEGNLAVIGIFIKEGKANSELDKIFSQAPKDEGKILLNEKINLISLLPKDRSYYTYSGSLTTPPCTEGVRWIILKKPITASKQQIEQFMSILKIKNNRPVQPINSRYIIESK